MGYCLTWITLGATASITVRPGTVAPPRQTEQLVGKASAQTRPCRAWIVATQSTTSVIAWCLIMFGSCQARTCTALRVQSLGGGLITEYGRSKRVHTGSLMMRVHDA